MINSGQAKLYNTLVVQVWSDFINMKDNHLGALQLFPESCQLLAEVLNPCLRLLNLGILLSQVAAGILYKIFNVGQR